MSEIHKLNSKTINGNEELMDASYTAKSEENLAVEGDNPDQRVLLHRKGLHGGGKGQ